MTWTKERPRRAGLALPALSALLVLAVAAVALTLLSLGLPQLVTDEDLVLFVVVTAEANLPTWFNVVLLAWGAAAHGGVALLAQQAGRPAWPWLVTAVLLAALSLDDLASLHERLEALGEALGGGAGVTHFAWVVPGLVLGVGVAAAAVLAARRLPRSSAVLLSAGIGLLLGTALGLELVGGALLDADGGTSVGYLLVSHLEELGEMIASVLLLAAAAAAVHVSRAHPGVALTYRGILTSR